MDDMAAVLGVAFMTAMIALLLGWAIWIVSRRGQERMRGRLDLQRRTLERLSTADELVAFIQTESGKRFLDSLSTEHGAHMQKIMTATRIGIILVLLGAGLCIMPIFNEDLFPLAYFGGMGIVLGAGFLTSAWASYRLARGWGLLPPVG